MVINWNLKTLRVEERHSDSWLFKNPQERNQNWNYSIVLNVCCCLDAKSCLTFVTPWTVAHQATLSTGFPRQEYLSGLPFPSPGDLLTQGWNPGLLCLLSWQQDRYHWATREPYRHVQIPSYSKDSAATSHLQMKTDRYYVRYDILYIT